ncbi:MAG TPA: wax ester/triacylglycerol synthase family O-acyltransferase [Acidimicrobiia bacterium]
MQRLEGLDSSFLYLESEATPMHVGMTCVFDPSTAPGGYTFGGLRRLVEDRLPLLTPFRRRLVEMPGHMHRPVWVDDPGFELDAHLHRATLPAPGGACDLEEFSADVLSRPLDRSRPLWEMHVLEGLEGGMVGAVTKVHHAAIDGVSGAELTANLLDAEPDPERVPLESQWEPDPVPSRLALARDAVWDLFRLPMATAAGLARTAAAAVRLRRHNREHASRPPAPFDAPRTRCNGPVTGRRHVAFTQTDLREVRAVAKAAGVTVNDVILAVCAGALRGHLEDHGGHPDPPLVAGVPVSVRTADDRGTMGNRLSAMLVDLATDVDDPVTRLGTIAAGSRAAKAQDRVLGPETVSRLADVTPAPVLAAMGGLESRLGLTARMPPVCNLIVSNFPGPSVPLYCAGARMTAAYPMGPLALGTGLNVTVQSYLDTLWFGIVSCPDTVPDPPALPARLAGAFHDLAEPVGVRAGRA